MKTLVIVLAMVGCIYLEANLHQKDIEDRAQVLGELTCYDNQDINYIITGQYE